MAGYASLDTGLCFKDGPSFKTATLPGGGLAYLRAGCDCPGLRAILARPDSLFDCASAILKDSRSSKAAISTIPGIGQVFVKRHNNKSLRYTLRHLLRQARSFRTWQAAWMLEQLGVPTPRPLAAIAFRKAFILTGSYLITEKLDGLLSAGVFVPELHASGAALDSFLSNVLKHLVSMHDNGISHGDLKFSNLGAVKTPGGETAFAGFMDLDSLKRSASPLGAKARAMDLARMAASLVAIVSEAGGTPDHADCCARIAALYEAAGGMAVPSAKIRKLSRIWLDGR